MSKIPVPKIHPIQDISLPTFGHQKLSNDIPVYVVNKGLQKALKVEIVFDAGRPFEDMPLVSRVMTSLFKKGTKQFNEYEIAEKFDYYGASLKSILNLDQVKMTIYSLTKDLEDLLPVVKSVLTEPLFEEKHLARYKRNFLIDLEINLQKNDVVAYRTFTEKLFGAEHYYGYNSSKELLEAISTEDIHHHFNRCINASNAQIFISGGLNDDTIELVNKHLGDLPLGEKQQPQQVAVVDNPVKISIQRKNNLQASLRIGQRTISRRHEDFTDFWILNTLLGGYFGSRLMTEVREKNGLTYNIYSSIDNLIYDSYFYISADVNAADLTATIQCIENELMKLRTELISEEELVVLKNYILGNFLTMIDGPFSIMATVKSFLIHNGNVESFDDLIQSVQSITPERIRANANKYLDFNDMYCVTVG